MCTDYRIRPPRHLSFSLNHHGHQHPGKGGRPPGARPVAPPRNVQRSVADRWQLPLQWETAITRSTSSPHHG